VLAAAVKGHEPRLAAALAKSGPGVVLVCWKHSHIPGLASALPLAEGTVIPKQWPDDRFDVVWTFTRATDHAYTFTQAPQLLLSSDTDTVIELG
jgi:hypothetical protein